MLVTIAILWCTVCTLGLTVSATGQPVVQTDCWLSLVLGLCSAQNATLRKQDFRPTWSVVEKCCRAMIGHSEGGSESQGLFWPELS